MSTTENRLKIQAWLKQQVNKSSKNPAVPLRLLRLVPTLHNPGPQYKEKIKEWGVDGVPLNIAELTSEMVETSETDAQGLGGNQKYLLLSYFGEDQLPDTRMPFIVTGGDDSTGNDNDALNNPSAVGVLAQTMKHLNQREALLAASLGEVLRTQSKIIEGQRQQLEGVQAQQVDMLRLFAEATDDKARRDAERAAIEASSVLKKQTFEQVVRLLPIIVAKLSGAALPDGSVAGQDASQMELLKSFMGSLTQQQTQALAPILSMEQQMQVMALLEGAKQEEIARQQNAQVQNAGALTQIAPSSTMSPE